MYYSGLIFSDIANGKGIRVTLYVSGCRHHCKGCFNPETWCFTNGKEFNNSVIESIYKHMDDYHDGLTLLGGDPLEPENIKELLPFIKDFKKKFPDKNIWVYSGYLYENIDSEILEYIDVLIDGEFKENLKDYRLKFRGSSNQRIIDVKKSIELNQVIELQL